MTAYIYWLRPPVTGLIVASANDLSVSAQSATDNTVHLSAARWITLREAMLSLGTAEETRGPYGPVRALPGTVRASRVADLPVEVRALYEWMKRQRVPDGVTVTEGSRALPTDQITALPTPVPTLPTVRYDGFDAVKSKSAHDLGAIHDEVVRCVQRCAEAWGWVPEGLLVQFHGSRRSLGLAFNPGRGDRRISLAAALLASYDLESVGRTVLHELCHHYREEAFPRGEFESKDSHDGRFCELLGRVDPKAKGDRNACRMFVEDVSEQAVAASTAKDAAVYTRESGLCVVGQSTSGRLRFRWEPREGFRWRPVWEPLAPSSLQGFLLRFPAADRPGIAVRYESVGRFLYTRLSTPEEAPSVVLSMEDFRARLARQSPEAWGAKKAAAGGGS